MDLIVSPTLVGFNTQPGSHPQPPNPNQIVDALVVKIVDETTARLFVADKVVDVSTAAPLVVGSTVRVAVRGQGDDARYTIIGPSPHGDGAPAPAHDGFQPATADAADAAPPLQPQAEAAAPAPPRAEPAQDNPTAALASAVRSAAAQQAGAAPLFADARKALELPSLPPAVRQALASLAALPRQFANGIAPADIRDGMMRSGLFLEAQLAAGADARAPGPLPDLKTVLLVLRAALRDWTQGAAPASDVALEQAAHVAAGADARTLPPPYRGAPTVGQAPMPATLDTGASSSHIAGALLERTDAALARLTLLQSASLSESQPAARQPDDTPPARWMFEIPFVVRDGAALAQVEIERDAHHGPATAEHPRAWRVNFSVDVEPTGPVHAQVALTGHRAAVRLWAERAATAAALRARTGELSAALREASLDAGDILVSEGAPPRPVKAAAAGHFLDRAT